MPNEQTNKVTVVLVHGAWADGSSWNKVAAELRHNFNIVSAQIPLTSLTDDVAALRRVLRREKGPMLLVGHSYGGAVITAAGAGNPDVKALVYIAAVVPDEGETVGDIFHRAPPHPKAPQLQPDEDQLLWLTVDSFRNAVAPDASYDETACMAETQKPIALKCLAEPMTKPAWREKPSWFLIAENDIMVSPQTQKFLAQRMNSEMTTLAVDHTPLISRPDSVTKIINEAAAMVFTTHLVMEQAVLSR